MLGSLDVFKAAYVDVIRRELKGGDVESLIAAARDPNAIRDLGRSPLTTKTAYFDKTLVDTVLQACGHDRSLDEFDESVRRASREELGGLVDWITNRDTRNRAFQDKVQSFNTRAGHGASDESELRALRQEQTQLIAEDKLRKAETKSNTDRLDRFIRRWSSPVPKLAHVSGIREKPFSRTPTDCLVSEGKDLPPVLDFLIQITYDTPPYFLNGDPPAYEDKKAWEVLSSYADPSPWEFPAISSQVTAVVRKSLETDPDMAADREAIATLTEFTLLQRLFRLGLAGELGSDFPIEALAGLHRATALSSPPPPVRTPRWDSKPGTLEGRLKSYVDAQLSVLDGGTIPPAFKERLLPGLKELDALAGEYTAQRFGARQDARDSRYGGRRRRVRGLERGVGQVPALGRRVGSPACRRRRQIRPILRGRPPTR